MWKSVCEDVLGYVRVCDDVWGCVMMCEDVCVCVKNLLTKNNLTYKCSSVK